VSEKKDVVDVTKALYEMARVRLESVVD